MTLEQIKEKINEDPESIDWESLSQYRALDQQFIEEYADKLDWNCISQYQTLDPDNFILPHKDEVNWNKIYRYQKLDPNWIMGLPQELLDRINFDTISETQELNSSFLKFFADKLNWDKISMYQNLSPADLDYHYDRLNKDFISRYQTLDETFIDTHKDDLCWRCISKCQNLSETFINNHLSYIDWARLDINELTSSLSDSFVMSHINDLGVRKVVTERRLNITTLNNIIQTIPTVLDEYSVAIARYQKLTEAFIELHNDYYFGNHDNLYIDWNYISYYQTLSETFMTKHKDRINWQSTSARQVLGQNFIRDNRDKVDWNRIIMHQHNAVSETFLMEFMDIELSRMSFRRISQYVPLSETTLIDNLAYIGWDNISRYQILSQNFINTYGDLLNRPDTICIDRDIQPTVPYLDLDEEYVLELLNTFNIDQEIPYNDFVEWHHNTDHMSALNDFWSAYDHYFVSKECADRRNNDYTNDIKKYRHFDWLM